MNARLHDIMNRPFTREDLLHCARVYLAESRRRGATPFAFSLLQSAANTRRAVQAIPPRHGTQMTLPI